MGDALFWVPGLGQTQGWEVAGVGNDSLQPPLLFHSAHTAPTALQDPSPLLQKKPSDLDPLTGIAGVWDGSPAAPPDHGPLSALLEREGPPVLAKAHSHVPLFLGPSDLLTVKEDASIARGGQGGITGNALWTLTLIVSSITI